MRPELCVKLLPNSFDYPFHTTKASSSSLLARFISSALYSTPQRLADGIINPENARSAFEA